MQELIPLNELVKDFDNLGRIEQPEVMPQKNNAVVNNRQNMIPMVNVYAESVSSSYAGEIKRVKKIGKYVAADIDGDNKLCIYEGDSKVYKQTDFLLPILEKAVRIIIHTKTGTEVWYKVYKKQYYVLAEETEQYFYIPQKCFEKWAAVTKVLAENGVTLAYTGRDARQLLETYVNNIVKSTIEYPYKSGWNNDKFMYNENGMIHKYAETPFLTSALITDENMSPKKAIDIIFEQLHLIEEKRLRLFIFCFMYLPLLGDIIGDRTAKEMIFGLYGDFKIVTEIGYLFFQIYNRNRKKINFLYDKEIVSELQKSKDEVFVIADNYPDTKYKRERAEENLSDIKDHILKGNCDSYCLIISDCGVASEEEDVFRITVYQKDIEEIEMIKEALGTHIKYFVEWVGNNIERFKDRSTLRLYDTFYLVYEIIKEYFSYVGGESIAKVLKLKSDAEVRYLIKKIIDSGYEDYHGSWICDQFRELFHEFNFKRVGGNEKSLDFYSIDPFAYITEKYVYIRRCDIKLFLKHFPKGVREMDILRALKKDKYIYTDNEKRYEKTVKFQKTPRKMIALDKDYIFPIGSVEGGMQI